MDNKTNPYPKETDAGMTLCGIMQGMVTFGTIESTAIFKEPFTDREFEIRFRLLKKEE